MYSFTDQQMAMQSLESSRIDVFVVSDTKDVDFNKIPNRCGFAYLVNSSDVETVNDQCAICKFQKIDLIYKQILSIYSEKAGSISGLKLDNVSTKIAIFNSVSGGTGASSIVAAYSIYLSSKGNKTFTSTLKSLVHRMCFLKDKDNLISVI